MNELFFFFVLVGIFNGKVRRREVMFWRIDEICYGCLERVNVEYDESKYEWVVKRERRGF